MSRITQLVRTGAIVGLLAAVAPLGAARAATPAPAMPSPMAPGIGADVNGSVTNPMAPGGDLACIGFKYSLGPFGPLGPWGPYGPLHDKDHPACFGGGDDVD